MPTPAKTPARPAAPAKQAARPAAPPPRQQTQAANAPQTARPAAPPAQQQARPQAPASKPTPAPDKSAALASTGAGGTAVARGGNQNLPDHIRAALEANNGVIRGSEGVEMQDLVIPRIELVQALSKCLEEGSAEYIEGARAGMLYNSVTRLLYGKEVLVCPVFFKKQYLAWKDRKQGGGFGGAFDSIEECKDRIDTETEQHDAWEAVETAQQIVLVVDPEDNYAVSEAVVSMARTKMKVSRQWNSLIRVNGFDRFSRLYELSGVDETNATNDSYKNFMVRYIDWAPKAVYEAAEDLYNSIAGGTRKVKIDDAYEDIEGTTIDGATGHPVGGEQTTPEY